MGAVLVICSLSACATGRGKSGSGDPDAPPPKSISEVLKQDVPAGESKYVSKNFPGEIVVSGVKLKNTTFDIPVHVNSAVEGWVGYFTGRGRPFFERYLERSEYFIPYIEPLLRQNGMPTDLVYLAMIESGFNNLARSRAKAVGPWQFMSATGKRYGLMVNWWVDERRDIRKSTLAAVEYLRDLYNMFSSWELASAAYNAGEGKVARAVQRYGSRDFWTISRHKYLKSETRNYVPKMIAAAFIAKNREQFGFKAARARPADDEAIAGDGEIVKVIKTDKPLEDKGGERVADLEDEEGNRAPSEELEDAAQDLATAERVAYLPEGTGPMAKPAPTPHISKDGVVGGAELAEFDLKSPADLLKVARAAGLSYQTVKSLNPELLRWCTPPNVGTYRIKLPASVKEKFLATYNHAAFPRKVEFLRYKVKKNETISRIAGHFGLKAEAVTDLNGVHAKATLRKGQTVMLPIPNDRSRSLASLEVIDPTEKRKRSRAKSKKKPKYQKISEKRRESARGRTSSEG
jgi:LysM repeat protein